MAWVELDASVYDSFSDCLAAADAIKDTTGSVILLPGGAIEGDGAADEELGVFLTLAGNNHTVLGTWFERGANRTFATGAVHMTSTADGCIMLGGSPGFLVDVLDEGGATVANKVYPPYQRAV